MTDIARQIITTRIFNHRLENLFAAWANQELMALWWGPHGFTNTMNEFNFTVGGMWNFTMHGSDGSDYKNQIRFLEIEKNRKILLDHLSNPSFQICATFDDLGGRSKLVFQMIFDSEKTAQAMKGIAIEGNEQTFDRLASLLDNLQKSSNPPKISPLLDLSIERVVDLPPGLLWQGWTEEKHLPHWFCPRPWSVSKCQIDLRPGGAFYTWMCSPEGQETAMLGTFLEIIPYRKLIFTNCLMANYRPTENSFFTAEVHFYPEGKETRYKAIALHKDEITRKKHEEMGFIQGWNIVLDQLVDYMKKIQAGDKK